MATIWIEGEADQQRRLKAQERRERSRHPRKYVDGCKTCEDIKAHNGFGPSHDASYGCESGWYEHCTCDTCF